MQKSAGFVGQQSRPLLSTNVEHNVLLSVIKLANFLYRSTNFVYNTIVIVYKWETNIYFVSYSIIFIFVH